MIHRASTNRNRVVRPGRRRGVKRRTFLAGAGGIAIGLPFLESMPERSAWAQDDNPIFTFFLCGANGIEPKKFFPSSTGALSAASMSGDIGVAPLADYADNLLILKGINYPGNLTDCGHAQGLVQVLTGVGPASGGAQAQAGGISADMVISNALNDAGVDPLTLYSGKRNYIAERLSFASAGSARPAELNPYNVYTRLLGLTGGAVMSGGADSTPVTTMSDELAVRRKSANDYVREDLNDLLARTDLSTEDRTRLEGHLEAVRDIEVSMVAAAEGCTDAGLNVSAIEAMENMNFSQNGHMIEDVVSLHSELVAFAFACNLNRTATLQWGDGTDGTIYDVPSNSRQWQFHHVSHRVQSDSASGNDPTAEAAHHEIDMVRMETYKHTIESFAVHGLLDRSIVLWTVHVSEGPSHSFRNLPYVIAGNGGGYLKQGQYIDGGGASNGQLLNTIINAAGVQSGSFGSASGELSAIMA